MSTVGVTVTTVDGTDTLAAAYTYLGQATGTGTGTGQILTPRNLYLVRISLPDVPAQPTEPEDAVLGGPGDVGTEFGGGIVGAYISTNQDGVATHALIVSPGTTEFTSAWGAGAITGAESDIDGPSNFAAMLAQSQTAALAIETDLNDAQVGGFSDWYLPADFELDAIYWELKPTTQNNSASGLANDYAVPARPVKTISNPVQTQVVAFQSGGLEAFTDLSFYWHSTISDGATSANGIQFSNGSGITTSTLSVRNIRAIRRVPVSGS